ncbi:PREDICTED: 14 kDa phosphohistidine phosphatase [Dipodomys ordii]|uniref:14 kDa phosphohistidine phosphatase n=1 Tax=Dipodomys ordii TaxID=10020 RepID=A0A1S3F270_DIPOR|nr:PREDICTED: 14 kDa phosphohistidine phosphatase [Dipodomys ordii]
MAAEGLAEMPDVDMDPEGVFKYVLIRVHSRPPSGAQGEDSKEIVRGYKWAEYHADIYDKVCGELQKEGYDFECLGGGRISHQSQDKKIQVYGYSMGYGQVAAGCRQESPPLRSSSCINGGTRRYVLVFTMRKGDQVP